jgi:hypothetical protein
LDLSAAFFNARVLTLPEKDADVIVNDWVEKTTEGKIKKIVGNFRKVQEALMPELCCVSYE